MKQNYKWLNKKYNYKRNENLLSLIDTNGKQMVFVKSGIPCGECGGGCDQIFTEKKQRKNK